MIACVVGVFSVLFDVSWMSFVPTLVKDSRNYVEANQKMGVTQSTTDVAGPGVAGVLIGWLGPPTVQAARRPTGCLSAPPMRPPTRS